MANFSLDIESEYDKSEVNNAFDQTKREIASRYDFKNTPADIQWLNSDKSGLKILGNSDYQIEAITDILRKKLSLRGQSQKILDTTANINQTNLISSQEIPLLRGLDQDKAKKITKLLRDQHPKIKTQIQGQTVRLTSSSKDELQQAIQNIKAQNLDFPINFTNFR